MLFNVFFLFELVICKCTKMFSLFFSVYALGFCENKTNDWTR